MLTTVALLSASDLSARRPHRSICTFTRNLTVPWTNTASEQARKDPNDIKPSSATRHVATSAGYYRVCSYLVSVRAINAIRLPDYPGKAPTITIDLATVSVHPSGRQARVAIH